MKKTRTLIAICLAIMFTGCGNMSSEKTDKQYSGALVNSEEFFTWDGNTIVGLTEAGAKQTELVIPEKCESINGAILRERENSVESIRFESDKDVSLNGSFANSDQLKSLALPAELSTIGNMEFWLCSNLEEIIIPGAVEVIGEYAFKDCTGLRKVVIEDGTTKISDSAFFGNTGLQSLQLPDSVTEIGEYAFHTCTSLKELVLPANLKTVGAYAFANTGLETLTVPGQMELESYDSTSFAQVDHDIHVNVEGGSWADQNFESVFSTSGIKD